MEQETLGFGRSYALREVRVQAVCEDTGERLLLNRPEVCAEWFRTFVRTADWFDPERECFVVAHLDRRHRLKNWSLVTIGTATTALAHPREVFRAAIVASATGVVCFHNHPSGDPSPSPADVQITRQLREAARIIDIDLIDHVIIGAAHMDHLGRGFYSFREAGII